MKAISTILAWATLQSAFAQIDAHRELSVGLNPASLATTRFELILNYEALTGFGPVVHLGYDISQRLLLPHNLDRNCVIGPYLFSGLWVDMIRIGDRTTMRTEMMIGRSWLHHVFRIRIPTFYGDYVNEHNEQFGVTTARGQLSIVHRFKRIRLGWGVAVNFWTPRSDTLAELGHWQVPGVSYELFLDHYDSKTGEIKRLLDKANEKGWSISPFIHITWRLGRSSE